MKKLIISTFGSDPEFAVVDNNDNVVIVEENLPGSKAEPFDIGDGIGIQPDGVAAEFTIPPAKNEEEFVKSILLSIEKGNKILKELNPTYRLKALSSAKYPVELLQLHPKCMEFGCSPSFNAYTLDNTFVPSAESVGEFRSFGFHIHLGIENLKEEDDDFVDCISLLMKSFDINVGLPSILVDSDVDRRRIYGTAGDFRFRTINDTLVVEYRVLGGFLLNSEESIREVFKNAQNAIKYYNQVVDDNTLQEKISACENEIQAVIKNGNVQAAETLLKTLNAVTNVQKNIPEAAY